MNTPPKKRLQPANRCIYCEDTGGKLTDEHIVPYFLGGNIELPNASCTVCQKKINVFEHAIARDTYHAMRSLYDLPSRTNSLLETIKVTINNYDSGQSIQWEKDIEVPISEAPVQIIIPIFPLPPSWKNKEEEWPKQTTLKVVQLPTEEDKDKRWKIVFRKYAPTAKHASISAKGVRAAYFARLLYKISWGFFRAEFPDAPIRSDLPEKIKEGNLKDSPVFDDLFSAPSLLQERGYFKVRLFNLLENGENVIYCRIRLFSRAVFPDYFCRVGACAPEISINKVFSPVSV